jgi:hypothetical protein
MSINELTENTTIENNLLKLLLEIEYSFRAEDREDLHSEQGRLHQNLLKIINEPFV